MRTISKLLVVTAMVITMHGHAQDISFERFADNPIIHEGLLPKLEGDNINGPSLIKVPDWVTNRLGKYYLYFAHHKGKYIRLAYADDLKGPWKIYQPGTLQLEDCICNKAAVGTGESVRHKGAENADDNVQHVASPDVLIDDTSHEIILYYHCPQAMNGVKGQYTLRAVSKDGLKFKSDDVLLGESYFRVFKWNGEYYAIGRSSHVYRSKDGRTAFEKGPNPFLRVQNPSTLRHSAVKVVGNTLWVFYSRVGDEPERILLSKIPLVADWNAWVPTAPITVVQSKEPYEGGDLPIEKSKSGLYYGKVHQLRDPYLFEEGKRWYLLYSVAGENGIGIGELKLTINN
ncbi:MAG TPA: hypothetical protein VK658_20790 [Chryseolinea sp.]|nr:hypothetical protein [Chryseolinea sp.]